MIEVRGLKCRYPHTERLALNELGFEVEKDQFIGVLGENRASRSTLCQALVGLMPTIFGEAYGGHILVDGVGTTRAPVLEFCRKVGLVLQNPFNQLSDARGTVSEKVIFGLQDMGVTREEILNQVERSLERLEIGAYRDRDSSDLSKGQTQRVTITSILAMEPEIPVLGESTSQLGPQGSKDVLWAIDRLAESGITIVVMEHKIKELASCYHRLLLLHNGEQVAYNTPGRIFAKDDLEKLGVEPPIYIWISKASPVNCPERNPEVDQECYLVTSEQTLALREYFPTQPQGVRKADQEPEVNPPVLSIKDVGPSYIEDSPALGEPNLELDERPTTIVGQDGAGKTALVELLKGLLKPDEGRILLQGGDIGKRTIAQLAGRMGYVFQNPDNQISRDHVLDEVMVGPLNLGMGKKRTEEMVIEALDIVGVLTVRNESPYDLDLSGKRVVVVASVLTVDPQVLILNEPAIAQGTGRRSRIGAMIHQLSREGKTVLATFHDMDPVTEYFEQILIMTYGHVLARGTKRAVFYGMDALSEARLEQPHVAGLYRLLGYEGTFLTVEDMIGGK